MLLVSWVKHCCKCAMTRKDTKNIKVRHFFYIASLAMCRAAGACEFEDTQYDLRPEGDLMYDPSTGTVQAPAPSPRSPYEHDGAPPPPPPRQVQHQDRVPGLAPLGSAPGPPPDGMPQGSPSTGQPPRPQMAYAPEAMLETHRSMVMCHTPGCRYLVHADISFGGFCCKRCHWQFVQGKEQLHGGKCQKEEAPPGSLKAPNVEPADPLQRARKAETVTSPDVLPAHVLVPVSFTAAVGAEVVFSGFIEYAQLNGLHAVIYELTPDGRYHLRLLDRSKVKWVKRVNFDVVAPAPPEIVS